MVQRTFPTILHPGDALVGADLRVDPKWWDYLDRNQKTSQALADDVVAVESSIDALETAIDALTGAWTNTRTNVTGDYTVLTSDAGHTLDCSNGKLTVTFGAASGYAANHATLVFNRNTAAGIKVAPNGVTAFWLFPGQHAWVFNLNNVWNRTTPPRYANSSFVAHVATNGSNTDNDGLAVGGSRAFLTPQHAIDTIRQYVDTNGSFATVKCASGTYTGSAIASLVYPLVGGGQLYIEGDLTNSSTWDDVVFEASGGGTCVSSREPGAVITILGVKIRTSGNGSIGLSATQGGVLDWGKLVIDAFPLGVQTYSNAGHMNWAGDITIIGGAAAFMQLTNHAVSNFGTFTATLTGTPAYTTFLSMGSGSIFDAGGVAPTFVGGATGQTYNLSAYSIGKSAGALIPGSTTATVTDSIWS